VPFWQSEVPAALRKSLIGTAGVFGLFTAVAALKYEIGGMPITEGVVYQKDYGPSEHFDLFTGNPFPIPFISADYPEERKIYIAQCPNDNISLKKDIEKVCKTNSFGVSSEIFSQTNLGQNISLKHGK
jgi:hypothetical protein